MDFVCFLVLNAILLIRPEELLPDIAGLRSYLLTIVPCLFLANDAIRRQLAPASLVRQPITVCVLGLLVAVAASHLVRLNVGATAEVTPEFVKVVLYYLLCVAVVNTPGRLEAFLTALVAFTCALTVLGLLQFHEVIDVPALRPAEQRDIDDATGELVTYPRLCSSGIYNDPNDLCLILVTATFVSLGRLTDPKAPFSLAWVAPIVLFVYAIGLTRSRGGLLALLAGLVVWLVGRVGWRRAAPAGLLLVPAILLAFGGRQADINLSADDTAQDRLRLWAEGLALFPGSPIFGVGVGEYEERVGMVAHNSYVHAFVEMGLLGGTLFAGAVFLAVYGVWRSDRDADPDADPGVIRLRPYLLAALGGYAAAMLSLSRCYIVPTALMLALATAYRNLAVTTGAAWFRCDRAMVWRLAGVGAVTLAAHKLFTQAFVQFG